MKLRSILAISVAVSCGLATLPSNAETFRAATWGGAGTFTDRFLNSVAGQVKEDTKGSVEFEVYSGGALLPPRGTLSGISSGVAHIAYLTAAYIPSDMPYDAVGGDLSFIADDQLALAFAKVEVSFSNEQLQNEVERNDLVFLTGFTVGIYYPICNFELNSLADLKGKKVRASSGAHINFATHFGAVPVSVPATEVYTGLQRGSIDCAFGDAPYLTEEFRLAEVARSVFQLPLGSNANGGYYANKAFWQERTPGERRAIFNVLSRVTARSMMEYVNMVKKAWDVAEEAGIPLNKPKPEDLKALEDYKVTFLRNLPQYEMDKRGVEDPTKLINQMTASVDKWRNLLASVDTNDADAVTALLNREIFDKIDVDTYGLN